MEEPSAQDLLFWDLTRKTTKVCFIKCVKHMGKGLTGKQETCVKDCLKRYLECRDAAVAALKDLAKRE